MVLLTLVLFAFPKVQTLAGIYASDYLQNNFGVDIQIENIKITPGGDIHLSEVKILDHHSHKMIYVDDLSSSLISFSSLFFNELKLRELVLNHFTLHIKTYKGEQQNSLTIFTNKFKPKHKKNQRATSKFFMSIASASMEDGNVFIDNENQPMASKLFCNNICGTIQDFAINESFIMASGKNLSFSENYGLNVLKLDTRFSYSNSEMNFEKTTLMTDRSTIQGDITFTYKNSDFSNFMNSVQMQLKVRKSSVSFKDLNRFYDDFNPEKTVYVSGNFQGVLNNFKITDLNLKHNKDSFAKGKLYLKNAFDREKKVQLEGSFSELNSDYDQLSSLLPVSLKGKLPEIIQNLGEFTIAGDIFISENKINTDLDMSTDIGSANLDLHLINNKKIDSVSYKGNINVIDFEIGKLINQQKIKKISLQAAVDGIGLNLESLNTQIKGTISKLFYKNYEYKNIEINGLMKEQLFNGHLEVNDDNVKLDFMGIADFSSDSYTYDFRSIVDYCDLRAIKLSKRDEVSKFKGALYINLKGTDVDDITGSLSFKDLFYTNQKQDYFFKDFNLNSTILGDGSKLISVDSPEIIKGSIRGNYKLKEVLKLAQNALGSIYSNYEPEKVTEGQKISFDLKVQDKIIEILFPEIELSPKTAIYGLLGSDDQLIKIWARSPKITAYGNKIENIDFQLDNKNPIFNTQLKVGGVTSDKINLSGFKLATITRNDTLRIGTTFKSGKRLQNQFDLSFFYTINKEKKSVLGLKKSKILYRDNYWLSNPTKAEFSKVEYDHDRKRFDIKPFLMSSGNQKLAFFGVIDQNNAKNITFNFTNVDLEKINMGSENQNFKGVMNGSFSYIEDQDILKPTADLVLSDFYINNSHQGDLKLKLSGNNSLKKYDVNALLIRDDKKTFSALGKIDFTPPKPRLNVGFNFDEFKLDVLSPLGGNVYSDIRGFVFGDVIFEGLLENPNMHGKLNLKDAGMYFPYINVDYQLDGETNVGLLNQNFNFDQAVVKDTQKNTVGILNGALGFKQLKNWFLDISIDSKNLLVLNTQQDEESTFYGTAFLNGNAHVHGPFNKLTFDVNGSTNKDTYFAVPISDVKTAEETQLIRFLSKDETENEKQRKAFITQKLSGLNLNFNLDINNNAVFEMVLDQSTGSNLKGSGTGNIQISLDTKDKFEMYGDILLDEGIYNFKYGGFINKPFDAKKGGSISWNGDPFTAIIDIEAVHRVSASPRTLLENINTNRRIPINLITRFSGELFNSERAFDIEIPNISNNLASEIAIRIGDNDENAKTRHFVSLLASGAFYNENNLALNTTGAVYGTATDLLSNAFEALLNQVNNKLKFKPEYILGERGGQNNLEEDDQLSLGLDFQMNDRILINGKVGVPIGDGGNQQEVISEVNIDFLLNKEGNLRSSAFNRQNEIQYGDEEEGYTQGVGLSYQIDFDNGRELLKKIRGKTKKRNKMDKEKDTIASKNNRSKIKE